MSENSGNQATDRTLGAICVVFALLCLFLWIPLDSETGLIEKAGRRLVIGDAFAPSVAACLLLGASLWLFVIGQLRRSGGALRFANIRFLVQFATWLALCLLIMRWAGPISVWLSGGSVDDYRLLRDSVPWKFIGYLVGGTLLVGGVVCWIERRMRLQSVLLSFAIVLTLALLYDLPFEDLLLPPNGDV